MFEIDDDCIVAGLNHNDFFDYTKPQLAIKTSRDNYLSLWCNITSVGTEVIKAWVLNGWYDIEIDRLTNKTKAPYEGGIICWVGKAPFSHYNDAMEWLRTNADIKGLSNV